VTLAVAGERRQFLPFSKLGYVPVFPSSYVKMVEVGPGQKSRDGSGTDLGRIHYPDPSRLGFFVPGHPGTVGNST
jgi:hypothetical protein